MCSFLEISDRPFKSLSQEKRCPDSVEDFFKQIENDNDSVEEDNTLEKDSSLEDANMSVRTNGSCCKISTPLSLLSQIDC